MPFLLAIVSVSCGRAPEIAPPAAASLALLPWDEITARAAGTTVHFSMWAGDDERNRYFQSAVTAQVRDRYGITLRVVPNSDTAEVVNKLLNEKRAGKTAGGSIDVVWINGENFRAARQAQVLWGPFAESLPNIRYYDPGIRQRDFGTAIEGYEAPWQKSQFVMAYDASRTPDPPRSFDALRQWVRAHPGRFTYIAPPDFTGSVFLRHLLVHFGGAAGLFQDGFDPGLYRRASGAALAYLNEIRPYLWKKGETYPATVRDQDRLFANREIDFAMNYGPDFASRRIARGEFPPTVRTFVLDSGAIGNYNYLAIPFNSTNIHGALVLINHLMSVEEGISLAHALGQPYPHRRDQLTASQRAEVEALPRGPATLAPDVLEKSFLPEPDAAYLQRLEKDWAEQVLRR